MLFVAALIAALAMASSIFIGRYWISAVEGLTDAAERLAAGDLAASIPVGGGKELTVLGNTMEQMRRNLVELTADLRRSEARGEGRARAASSKASMPSTRSGASRSSIRRPSGC